MLLDVLTLTAHRLALLCALFISPVLLVRSLSPRSGLVATLAAAGLAATLLNTLVPLGLHLAAMPLTASSLATAHAACAAVFYVLFLLRRSPPFPKNAWTGGVPFLLIILIFAALVVPVTYLAGIDTYKWQGLATNVRVEQNIPWLIHPLSLLGFTPRSYPSAQPLLLATIQILGHVGVDGGFYILSLFCGAFAVMSAGWLSQRLFANPRQAVWLSFIYVTAPVFMRYNHWATGRGLFLACLPMLLAAGLKLRSPRHWLLFAAAALALPLAHKSGLLAVGVILPASLIVAAVLPRRPAWGWRLLLLLPCMALAILVASPRWAPFPLGCLPGAIVRALTRFFWLAPAAILGAFLIPRPTFGPGWRWMLAWLALSLPLSTANDMYGALIALPAVALFATAFIETLQTRLSRRTGSALLLMLASLSLVGALGIVVHRSRSATPTRVREAARFLEGYDPLGPYRILAPGRARVQMHAYVSGCPRFVLYHDSQVNFMIHSPPPISGKPANVVQAWMDYGRTLIEPSDVEIDWYGQNPREYYVQIDGEGDIPERPIWIYDRDGIRISKPAATPSSHEDPQ